MAANPLLEPLLGLKEQVTCVVCLEVYKEPKSLTCHHAFCIKCIDRLPVDISKGGEYQIKCPSCRELTVLSGDGSTDGLPPAFHVNAMVELYNATITSGPASRQPAEEPRDTDAATAYRKCPFHPQRNMEMFCEDCQKFICLECSIREHRNHGYDLVNVMHPKCRVEIEDQLAKLNERVEVIAKAHEMLANRATEATERGCLVKKRIDAYIQSVVEHVQNHGNELKGGVDVLVQQETEKVSAQMDKVRNTLEQLKRYKECVEKELQNDVRHQILEKKTELVEKMREIIRENVISEPPDLVGFLFCPDKSLVERYSKVGAISSVMLSTPRATGSVAKCRGKGATMALVGKETTFDLHLSTQPDDPLTCSLYNEDCGPLVHCRVEKTGTKVGQRAISYTPTRAGLHYVILKAGGVVIPCDPHTIRVHSIPSPETRTKREMGGAKADRPWAVEVTTDNDLLVVSEVGGTDQCVTVRDRGGEVLVRVGEDLLYDPTGIMITEDHHLIVADAGNHRVLKFTLEGALVAEGNKRLQILFSYPYGVATGDGLIYVSDSRHHCIHILHPDLSFSYTVGKRGRGPGQFENPAGLAVDSRGTLYVCDSGNCRVQRLSPGGKYISEFGRDFLLGPLYVSVDLCDMVYVTDEKSCQVAVFDSAGSCIGGLGGKDQLAPRGIAVDSTGYVYICDYASNKVIIYV